MYDIDGIGNEDVNEDDQTNNKNGKLDNGSPNRSTDKKPVKSSKQILKNAGQKSEFDSGMNNCQINQNNSNKDSKCDDNTTYCTPVYGQIVSIRENHNQINEIQQKYSTNETTKPSSSFRTNKMEDAKKKNNKNDKKISNGKSHFDFFPVFDNKVGTDDKLDIKSDDTNIIDPMKKLVLKTDNNFCDNKNSTISSFSS